MRHTDLKIDGMSCAGCVASVRHALLQLPGVRAVDVDLPGSRAAVEHDDDVPATALAAAVNDAGYDAAVLTVP